jgi:hypothetical protein
LEHPKLSFYIGHKNIFFSQNIRVTIKYLYIHMNIFLKFLEIFKCVF